MVVSVHTLRGRVSLLLGVGLVAVLGVGALGVPPGEARSPALIETDSASTSAFILDPEGFWPRRSDATLMAEVGGSGADSCNLAQVTQVTVGASGSPNTITINGNSKSATAGGCYRPEDTIWWEAFQIDKCARVLIDHCGTSPALSRFGRVLTGCAADGSSCGPSFPDSSDAANCGPSGNFTSIYDALAAGTYYYPIRVGTPGPYVMRIKAEECSGACSGCFGACCDFVANTCVDDVQGSECAGAQETWFAKKNCCNVECRDPAGPEFGALGVELLAHVSLDELGSAHCNDIWAYVSPGGRKYAIVGLYESTAFVDVTDPRSPVVVTAIPGVESPWSDMATFKTFAYNVNEAGGGMQIIDLGRIDSGVVRLTGSAAGGMATAHNVFVNEESGFAYPCGTDVGYGFLVFDLSDPADPSPVGSWNDVYVHDLYVHSFDACPWAGRTGQPCELAYAFCGGDGMYIVDVTDKSNMATISTLTYPTVMYCHQGWLSEDGRHVFFNDETDERFGTLSQTRTYVADVQDPANPTLAATFDHDGCWIDHNLMPKGDRVYQAHYAAGLRILDVQDPLLPIEVAHFDTHPEDNVTDFVGAWGVYAGLPSRVTLVSDIERGLFVLCDQPHLPLPSFLLPNGPGFARAPTAFDASSSTTCDAARSIAAYEWDFDYDGATFDVDATSVAPENTFAASGAVVVALRITDDLGAQAVSTLDVMIGPAVPAVSQWGLVVMVLLTLIAGSVVLARRRTRMVVATV